LLKFERAHAAHVLFEEGSPGDKLYIMLRGAAAALLSRSPLPPRPLRTSVQPTTHRRTFARAHTHDQAGSTHAPQTTYMPRQTTRMPWLTTHMPRQTTRMPRQGRQHICPSDSTHAQQAVAQTATVLPCSLPRAYTAAAAPTIVDAGNVQTMQGRATQLRVAEGGLSAGTVHIMVGTEDHVLASRSDGEYFGELALVEDTPRTATVSPSSQPPP
jgi:hypothetical protein